MELSRREFLKASGAGMGGLVLLGAMDSGKPPPRPSRLVSSPLVKHTLSAVTVVLVVALSRPRLRMGSRY